MGTPLAKHANHLLKESAQFSNSSKDICGFEQPVTVVEEKIMRPRSLFSTDSARMGIGIGYFITTLSGETEFSP